MASVFIFASKSKVNCGHGDSMEQITLSSSGGWAGSAVPYPAFTTHEAAEQYKIDHKMMHYQILELVLI